MLSIPGLHSCATVYHVRKHGHKDENKTQKHIEALSRGGKNVSFKRNGLNICHSKIQINNIGNLKTNSAQAELLNSKTEILVHMQLKP